MKKRLGVNRHVRSYSIFSATRKACTCTSNCAPAPIEYGTVSMHDGLLVYYNS